jgi:hypothetical protein
MACLRRLYPIEDRCLLDDFGRVSKRPWEPNLTLVLRSHPKTDGQTERKNQTLEDMLHMYVMDQQKHWEEFLPLVEFTYNNSYQSTIKMAPFEFLYGRPCQTPLSWDRLKDRVLVGPKAIQEMEE